MTSQKLKELNDMEQRWKALEGVKLGLKNYRATGCDGDQRGVLFVLGLDKTPGSRPYEPSELAWTELADVLEMHIDSARAEAKINFETL